MFAQFLDERGSLGTVNVMPLVATSRNRNVLFAVERVRTYFSQYGDALGIERDHSFVSPLLTPVTDVRAAAGITKNVQTFARSGTEADVQGLALRLQGAARVIRPILTADQETISFHIFSEGDGLEYDLPTAMAVFAAKAVALVLMGKLHRLERLVRLFKTCVVDPMARAVDTGSAFRHTRRSMCADDFIDISTENSAAYRTFQRNVLDEELEDVAELFSNMNTKRAGDDGASSGSSHDPRKGRRV